MCEIHINDYDEDIVYIANFVTSFITAVQNKESNFNLTNSRLRLVSGTTNPKLAEEIASYLGIENVPLVSKRFADGEIYIHSDLKTKHYICQLNKICIWLNLENLKHVKFKESKYI